MSNEISISQEDLDNLTYDQFLSQFTIYPTQKAARAKDFEAHHLIPVSIQRAEYKKKNNSNIPKKEFRKILPDDRCIRLTTLEHLIIHYLLAKQFGNDYIEIFAIMCNHNICKLTFFQKCTLEQLKNYAVLREKGREISSSKRKGKQPWNKGLKGAYSEEYINKIRNYHKNCTKDKNPAYGRHWYNNGVTNIYLNPEKDKIPEGFTKGMLVKDPSVYASGKNRRWYTNGVSNLYILIGDTIPEGYHKGRTFQTL